MMAIVKVDGNIVMVDGNDSDDGNGDRDCNGNDDGMMVAMCWIASVSVAVLVMEPQICCVPEKCFVPPE